MTACKISLTRTAYLSMWSKSRANWLGAITTTFFVSSMASWGEASENESKNSWFTQATRM
eukprot:10265626-Alexandrium_andersonii.AAC.1